MYSAAVEIGVPPQRLFHGARCHTKEHSGCSPKRDGTSTESARPTRGRFVLSCIAVMHSSPPTTFVAPSSNSTAKSFTPAVAPRYVSATVPAILAKSPASEGNASAGSPPGSSDQLADSSQLPASPPIQ